MSGTKPTPGPWRVVDRHHRPWTDALCIVAKEDGCEVDIAITTRGMEGDENGGLSSWANARLIVRAVNCHADLVAALEALVADVLEYERINNLAPNPGRRDCWQSVTNARAILSRAQAPLPSSPAAKEKE